MVCALRFGKGGGASAGQPAKHGAFHQTRPAGIIVKKETTGNFSRGEKPADHISTGVLNFAIFGDADAAKRKGYAARHRKGIIRRRIQSLRPVRLHRTNAVGAFAVVFRWIEGRIVHGIIELVDRLDDILPIQARQFFANASMLSAET